MQECTLRVEGCRPIYEEGVCCPVRYVCGKSSTTNLSPINHSHPIPADYEEDLKTTTTEAPRPTPGLILTTTTAGPLDCQHNGNLYADGASIETEQPCEHCYCMRGEIVCAVQECGTPLDKENCTALPPPAGVCCPEIYHCGTSVSWSIPGVCLFLFFFSKLSFLDWFMFQMKAWAKGAIRLGRIGNMIMVRFSATHRSGFYSLFASLFVPALSSLQLPGF